MIDDVEYRFFHLLLWGALRKNSADAQMGLSALLFRNQRVGCFMDPVMKKAIGILRTKDEAGMSRFPELIVHFFP